LPARAAEHPDVGGKDRQVQETFWPIYSAVLTSLNAGKQGQKLVAGSPKKEKTPFLPGVLSCCFQSINKGDV
jgi:hypothetical protein